MRKKVLMMLFMVPLLGIGQNLNVKGNYGGMFSLGVRSTASMFNGHQDESGGFGSGGQFRLQFADHVNSDWFFDYLRSSIGNYASRTDYHIGWSVLFYPTAKQDALIRPYILAGHCFDYTRIVEDANTSNYGQRWSSAVQGGLGTHLNISQRMDLSFTGQYMIHLGNEVHAEREGGLVSFHTEKQASMEGHLLFTVGLNYKIADLW